MAARGQDSATCSSDAETGEPTQRETSACEQPRQRKEGQDTAQRGPVRVRWHRPTSHVPRGRRTSQDHNPTVTLPAQPDTQSGQFRAVRTPECACSRGVRRNRHASSLDAAGSGRAGAPGQLLARWAIQQRSLTCLSEPSESRSECQTIATFCATTPASPAGRRDR